MAKIPQADDIAVGGNVRRVRLARGLSQEKLADQLGVTFQQVQKYEKGTNRIGSSRLVQICGALDCTIAELFRGIAPGNGGTPRGPDPVEQIGATAQGHRFAELWMRMRPKQRQAMIDVGAAFLGRKARPS